MFTLVGFLWRSKVSKTKLSQTINLLTFLYSQSTFIKGEDLSEKFSLSKRSIRRLISELRDLGYDIESITGPYGGYKLNRSQLILPVKMTSSDKQAFLAIKNTIKGSDLLNKEASLRLLDIIGLQSQLSSVINTEVYFTKKLLPQKSHQIENVYAILNQAISEKRRVEIKYQSLSKTKTDLLWQEFRPQAFQVFNGIIYIKGYYSESSESFRILRLSRFEDIKLSHKKYSFNKNYEKDNAESAFSKAVYKMYHVKLKIYKGNHDLLDYKYGDSQVIEEFDDHYILKFDLAGDLLIKELVLSMGSFCQLLEPINIRREIIKEIIEISKLYK